jgi:VanZ family protein
VSRTVRAWGPALLWAAVIFALSSRSTLPVGLASGGDKLAHFAAYAVLGFLLARGGRAYSLALAWPILLGVLYGASDELHQSLVPGRAPELADWLADAAGALAGAFLYYRWRRSPGERSPRRGGAAAESLAHE